MREIKFGYSSNIDTATPLTQESIVEIAAYANGNCKALNSLNYFYLFAPYWKNTLNVDIEYFLPSITGVSWFWEIEWKEDSHLEGWYYDEYSNQETVHFGFGGYCRIKVYIGQNNTEDFKQHLLFITAHDYIITNVGGELRPTIQDILITRQLNIIQDGQDKDNTSTGENFFYYKTDITSNNAGANIKEYTAIKAYPETLSLAYSYNDSTEDTIHNFNYVYIRSNTLETVNNLNFYAELDWAKIISTNTYTNEENNIYVRVLQILVNSNNTNSIRNGLLNIKADDVTILSIVITLYGTSHGDTPIITPDINGNIDTDENKYWKNGVGSFSITDMNTGSNVDPTFLLYKSNTANIYKTIEQKDNTLFLGNYTNEAIINKVHEIMDKYINTDKVLVSEGTRDIEVLTLTSLVYQYLPNLLLNSQLKKLFKKGETYALGIVFVYKTGAWSSVYYLGDIKGKWAPSVEPVLIEENNKTTYKKVARYCILGLELTATLAAMGIIAVIPVYAVKNSYNIMCQGFLSPTISSTQRKEGENIESLYSWFYRTHINTSTSTSVLPSGVGSDRNSLEILNLDTDVASTSWEISRQIFTLNTPEVEVDEYLTESMMSGCLCRLIRNYSNFAYSNNISLQVNGKYLHSYFSSANVYQDGKSAITTITNLRFISGYLWRGFLDLGYETDDNTRTLESGKEENYKWFRVYPWQRDKVGGEGPTSQITNKRLFNSLYNKGTTAWPYPLNLPKVEDTAIYRDFDSAAILRIATKLYLGNTDYIQTTEENEAYKAWTADSEYPKAHEEVVTYAGYDTKGRIKDPINIKYKTAPHIVLKFNSNLSYSDTREALFCVELYNNNDVTKTETQDLTSYQWIKCGDLKRIISTEPTTIFYEEGDYFFGRFDSLRTYCYTEEDVNSVVEVVSGMLCSRVNLDARCDRNRGANTPTLNPRNFNIFNKVYNQLNNYFTFNYIDANNVIYKRSFSNSIQWSLTKSYSSDVDNWCNIQDSNTLDLDGDKGLINAIYKLGNNLIAFLDTGISLILYNEKTLIATNEGVPIEIMNSGKVNGKFYLYDNIGCLDYKTITKSPNGIYFIDSINKTIYQLKSDGSITDICTSRGMKSWGLSNLTGSWWSYYDNISQEVLFTNELESLSYSDAYQRFNAFLGYGGIRWNFRMKDLIILICPTGFNLVISTTYKNLLSLDRVIETSYVHDNIANTFWKKNSIDSTNFFGKLCPIEIELNCNPEPTLDKTFSIVEYRADAFNLNGEYLPYKTFDTFRAWNEYQDTLPTSLIFEASDNEDLSFNRRSSVRLKKKFRVWRIDIPRAKKVLSTYINRDTLIIDNLLGYDHSYGTDSSSHYGFRDRIRNPWCKIYLSMDTLNMDKFILNDLTILYFK